MGCALIALFFYFISGLKKEEQMISIIYKRRKDLLRFAEEAHSAPDFTWDIKISLIFQNVKNTFYQVMQVQILVYY